MIIIIACLALRHEILFLCEKDDNPNIALSLLLRFSFTLHLPRVNTRDYGSTVAQIVKRFDKAASALAAVVVHAFASNASLYSITF